MNFTDALTSWYLQNRRDLPWRNTTDAYTIWLSEIILQQTRVAQGLPYFNRFLEAYPTVLAFAAASEDEILKIWQGLGYYSRGRNMLYTARLVADKHQGVFPSSYNELIELKGIGEYTAAAISSFAANEPKAVVDGNVSRVISRYFGIEEPINSTKGKKLFQQIANDLLHQSQPGLHNQAMMEFGAIICKPKNPNCTDCIVRVECFAFNNNKINQLPVKLKTVKVKERFFNYILISDIESLILNKRDESDIWANMYDLPLIETARLLSDKEILESNLLAPFIDADVPCKIDIFDTQKHILTHQCIYYRFIKINVDFEKIKLEPKWFLTKVENLKNFALPKLIFIFLTNFFKL
jgi:A/G-specific adenine glycosylase